MIQDASDRVDTTGDRKPWTAPMVIVAESEDTEAKGTTTSDIVSAGGTFGS